MKSRQLIHILALVSLSFIAIGSIASSTQKIPGAQFGLNYTAPIFGALIWSFLIWKIWTRPRKWGPGVGILLFLMICFQTYLWRLAVENPHTLPPGTFISTKSFVLDELRLFIAGFLCILLRFVFPKEQTEG